MRLGGYVIHGDDVETLGACLDSLASVCDEVVAVDSGSTDGSAALVEARGVRAVSHPWAGYGAARAAAVRALGDCDYLFFLDSDERLAPGAGDVFQAWRESDPSLPHYRLRRRDRVELPGHDFVFRTEVRTRLVRADAATWSPAQIVHEALPRRPSEVLSAIIDHRFVTELAIRDEKLRRYALLWAVQQARQDRPLKSPATSYWGHMFRNLVLKGALFRGGRDAVAVSRVVAAHHAWKYRYLAAVRQGAFSALVEHFEGERYRQLFEAVGTLELGGPDGGIGARLAARSGPGR